MKTNIFAASDIDIMSPDFAGNTPDATAPLKRFAGHKFHFIGAGGIGMSGLAKLF
jgi:hypothetical protein